MAKQSSSPKTHTVGIQSVSRAGGHAVGASLYDADPMTVLLGKFQIATGIFEMVESKFEAVYPYLMPGVYYSWQDILGEDFWSDMLSVPVHFACISLQHMAEQPGAKLTASHAYCGGKTYFQIS